MPPSFAVDRSKQWLHICVSNGYTSFMRKDVGLHIRVERELRDDFLEACRVQDKPAAQVIREFMKRYIAKAKTNAHDSAGVSHKK